MLKHWKGTFTLLAVAAAVGLVSAGLALGKKPPKPPPEPDPDPPEVTVNYEFIPLGTLPGDTSYVSDVNNLGEVVGYSQSADGVYHAFVYADVDGDGAKEMVALNDLIDPDPGPEGDDWNLRAAFGINDFGQICGSGFLNGVVENRAFRFTPGVDGAWPVVDDLGTFEGISSSARAVNDHGVVVGTSLAANGTSRPFVWTAEGGIVGIGDLDQPGDASGINNFGQVTGSFSILVARSSSRRAFRYTPGVDDVPGVMEDLGDFGVYDREPVWSSGHDINDDGYVVGGARNAVKYGRSYPFHAFVYTDHMIDLGTLGGDYSIADAINSAGEVVGRSKIADGSFHGFLYTNKTDTGEFVMVKLEDLILDLPPGFQGQIYAENINDLGEICGQADGEAFLLTPVEP